jgi:hypothetical protein
VNGGGVPARIVDARTGALVMLPFDPALAVRVMSSDRFSIELGTTELA